jgi:hypothetical protein
MYTTIVDRYPIPIRAADSWVVRWTALKDDDTLNALVTDLRRRLN